MKLFWLSITIVVILSTLPLSLLADPKQEFKVTIQAKRTELSKVFNEIRRQTGFVVFYSNDLFNDKEKINVNFVETGLDDVMRSLLRGRSLSYKIAENFIIIIRSIDKKKDGKALVTPPAIRPATDTLPAYKLKGKVTGKEEEAPLGNVSVENLDDHKGVFTNGKGEFTINRDAAIPLSTRQLVNSSTRQLVNSSTRQLVNSSTRQLVNLPITYICHLHIGIYSYCS
jgi:hypothetical protein